MEKKMENEMETGIISWLYWGYSNSHITRTARLWRGGGMGLLAFGNFAEVEKL